LRIINQTPNNSDKRTKIYIYTESHTAIQRLQKIQDLGPGRDIVQKCAILAQSLQNKGIETTIRRVPKGSKIQGTIIADNLAKKGAKSISNLENPISLYQIRRRLNQSIKEKWICYWNRNKKGRHYLQFQPKITQKTIKTYTDRRTWTAYIQLKLGHGYFRSYLSRLQQYETDKCIGRCKGIQSPSHLFLSCYHYREDQKKLKDQLKEIFPETEIITLTEIYNEKSRQIVYDYLKKTRIATRDWLLGLEKEDEETESQEAGTQEEEQEEEETE
jgi:hypothetical protein